MRIHEVPPILRWPGGKRWLCSYLGDRTPKKHRRYYEPFIGSAAVYFFLRPSDGCISDVNDELINFYQCLQEDWKELLDRMMVHQAAHNKIHYYNVRSKDYGDRFDKAARTLYLNRTCWNGLYRVNVKGQFNVPIGTKNNFSYDFDKFQVISDCLRSAEIVCSDFEPIIARAGDGDFVFVDPPYTVKHNRNGFRKYNEKMFAWSDQIRLRDSVRAAQHRGATVLVTNADHDSIRELYDFSSSIEKLSRKSVIAPLAQYRGHFDELLIRLDPAS